MTLATVGEGGPWCSHCFYAWTGAGFVFATDTEKTRHGSEMLDRPVAAAISLETKVVGRLQGVQIEGIVREAGGEERRAYLLRFPYAVAADVALWVLDPTFAKMTDNTLGFGKKIVWNACAGA